MFGGGGGAGARGASVCNGGMIGTVAGLGYCMEGFGLLQ